MDSTALEVGLPSRTLPARYYTDATYFGQEFERFFGQRWVCVGRWDEIAGRGDHVLRTIGDESLIVVRDAQDGISAFYNVCRHRGTRLCTAPRGTFAATIACPYHAWTYDLSGRLVGTPGLEEGDGFQREDFPLRRAAVDTWDGHIFVNLSEQPRPLLESLGELPARFQPWGMGELRLGARITYDVAANWKLIVQNYSECLHCPVIHPALQRLSHYLSGVNESATSTSTYLGGWMTLREGIATMNMDGKPRRVNLPGLDSTLQRRVYYYAVLPNLLLSLHPDYVMTHTLWPKRCNRTEVVCEFHFRPEAISGGNFDPGDAVQFWDMTNRQDWQVSELSQLGMMSRAYAPGPYSGRETLLAALDRIVLHDEEEAKRNGSS